MATIQPIHRNSTLKEASSDALLRDAIALVENDMGAVNRHIQAQLSSDVALIQEIGHYIVAAGGKRLRPVTVLLS
ncbi:MAG: hypothetical protein VW771_07895, partial [Gammaproteobacteria bacterium]